MVIDLAKVEFTNDLFLASLPNGKTLVLNAVNESLLPVGAIEETEIKAINIELRDIEGGVITCPVAIGLGNEYMQINTEYKEYEGDVLTPDNMMYCTIEIYG